MERCLYLAKLGTGTVAPNPLVGSLVVSNGEIIGEGYHQEYGGPHAEVNAIHAVKDKSLLQNSTIYVNLEPCAHFGKTPPCADLIIKSQIPRVVIGCIDTYSEVAGKGIERMRNAGIEVIVGVLEEESIDLNRRFFTFHTKKRPYIILKWAQSADGFIDIDRHEGKKGIFWITQPETQVLVHKWRHEESAILVGKNTIANDNPSLTCRAYDGNSPIRLIIDQKMKLDYGGFKVGDRSVQTYVLTEKKIISSGQLEFIQIEEFNLKNILAMLYTLNIQSVIIEGGRTTLDHFITTNLWDEARILQGNTFINQGIKAPLISGKMPKTEKIGNDTLTLLRHA